MRLNEPLYIFLFRFDLFDFLSRAHNTALAFLMGEESKVRHLLLLRPGCVSRLRPHGVIYAAEEVIFIFSYIINLHRGALKTQHHHCLWLSSSTLAAKYWAISHKDFLSPMYVSLCIALPRCAPTDIKDNSTVVNSEPGMNAQEHT